MLQVIKTGKLKERTIKMVWKDYGKPNTYWYAEAGTGVTWSGGSGNPEHYGGRMILWCTLDTGESLGLEEGEVDWDEVQN